LKKSFVIITLLVSLLALGIFAASCGSSGTTTTSSPKQVVTTWLDNLKNGNWAASYKPLSAADKKKISEKEWIDTYSKQGKPPTDVKFVVSSEKITGNKATVDVKVTQGGQSQTGTIALVKEGNDWKISASASSQTP
jgi:hypothetical protein